MAFVIGLALVSASSLLFLFLCVVIEHIAAIERYSLKDRVPGFLMYMVGTALGYGLIWPFIELWKYFEVAPLITIPLWSWLKPLGVWGYALQFLALVAIADLLAYWRHRAEHSRWLWPVHAVHHAPTELHGANDIGHPLQSFFSLIFIFLPMSLIEIDGPVTPFALGALIGFLSVYIHSPIDFHFGPLRAVIVDNRFHRIHHSLEPKHFHKNFGICFSIWDRMFGTAYFPQKAEWPKVGVAEIAAPRTLRDYMLLPFHLGRSDTKVGLPSSLSTRLARR